MKRVLITSAMPVLLPGNSTSCIKGDEADVEDSVAAVLVSRGLGEVQGNVSQQELVAKASDASVNDDNSNESGEDNGEGDKHDEGN